MFYLLMGTRRPLCQREPTAETRTDLQSNRNKRIHFLYTALSQNIVKLLKNLASAIKSV